MPARQVSRILRFSDLSKSLVEAACYGNEELLRAWFQAVLIEAQYEPRSENAFNGAPNCDLSKYFAVPIMQIDLGCGNYRYKIRVHHLRIYLRSLFLERPLKSFRILGSARNAVLPRMNLKS
jgi:hypothetical protein